MPLDHEGSLPIGSLEGMSLIIQSNIHSELSEESTHIDFEELGVPPHIVRRKAHSFEEFLSTIRGEEEAVLMPEGFFDNPAVRLRDDRVLARLEPRLLVTSFLLVRTPPTGDPDHAAVSLFERFLRERAEE